MKRGGRAARASAAALPPASRPALAAALALALAGVALALLLTRLHVRAHAGETSFCAVSETVNCDKVATSAWSVVLGLPVSLWGALGYGLAAILAGWGLASRKPHPAWPAGLLAVVAGIAVAASAALAYVSHFLVRAWCLLCMGSWAIAVALLAAALAAGRAAGLGRALRADLAATRARPLPTAALAVVALGVLGAATAAYPRYWDRPPPGAAARPDGGRGDGGRAVAAAPGAPLTIVEYSDYECPFCARAHEEMKALRAERPGLTVVRRHYPLDPSCNPALKKLFHPSACALARAGICAEAQGRFEPMDDALFRNQKAGRPVEELARDAGLDVARFRACLGSPETARRLAEDVAAGARDGVAATPTYVVGGVAYAGQLPPEVLDGAAAPAAPDAGR